MSLGIMLIYGGLPFMVSTIPYQGLDRKTAWKWAELERFALPPLLQYTGKEAETIALSGTLCPEITGGRAPLEALRILGDLKSPLPLITGTGLFLGIWVLTEIKETQDVHFQNGVPRRLTFDISLKKSADGYGSTTGALAAISRAAQLFG